MSELVQLCYQCADLGDDDCKMCPLGNPCLGCEDYDQINHVCKSNGGCTPEKRMDEIVDALCNTPIREHTVEEYMYGQNAGNLEDGSL